MIIAKKRWLVWVALPLLTSCGAAGRLAEVGRAPRFSKPEVLTIEPVEPSIARPNIPPAAQTSEPAQNASLFRVGAGDLFRDQRASQRGDILTIRINVSDKAAIANTSSRERSGSENAGLASLLGITTLLDKILPGKGSSSDLVKSDSKSRSEGSGKSERSETINMTMAAIVTEVLPNGNLVIRGKQEMRVNYELRELVVTGIIRPQDIARDNSILHSQIAEARISYGGRGQITSAQQARWAQQIYDALFPF
jgi:flagellar L-ring protein precursor FlgH